MKLVIKILCFLSGIFIIWFPFAYFHGNLDKKEVKVSHILVDTKEEAIQIKKQLDEGKDFAELAQKYSTCPSKDMGGDLGYTFKGKFVPEVEKVVFTLPLNEISQPVKSSYGWHIIKNNGIKYFSDKESFSTRYYYKSF